jgi:GH18 family chitinase
MNANGDATPYLLSAAVSAGVGNYTFINVPQMDAALDSWNVMSYDYAGSWSQFTDNQVNLYGPSLSGYGTDAAIRCYTSQGATPAEIILGISLYGRAFENTAGIGSSYNGVSFVSGSSAFFHLTWRRLDLVPSKPASTRTRTFVSTVITYVSRPLAAHHRHSLCWCYGLRELNGRHELLVRCVKEGVCQLRHAQYR